MHQGQKVGDATSTEAGTQRREPIPHTRTSRSSSQLARTADPAVPPEPDERAPEEAGYGYGV
jgi:hypothetical protein